MFKKMLLFFSILALFLFMGCSVKKAEVAKGPQIVTALKFQNVDQDHNATRPIGTVEKGQEMEVIGVFGDYIKVSDGTREGFVWEKLLDPTANTNEFIVNGQGATVNLKPDQRFPAGFSIMPKTKVTKIETAVTWYKVSVKTNGMPYAIGWVYAPYCK